MLLAHHLTATHEAVVEAVSRTAGGGHHRRDPRHCRCALTAAPKIFGNGVYFNDTLTFGMTFGLLTFGLWTFGL